MNTSAVLSLAQKVAFVTLRNTYIFACYEFTFQRSINGINCSLT